MLKLKPMLLCVFLAAAAALQADQALDLYHAGVSAKTMGEMLRQFVQRFQRIPDF